MQVRTRQVEVAGWILLVAMAMTGACSSDESEKDELELLAKELNTKRVR